MTTVVRYTVHPGRAEENAGLVRAVYAELAQRAPAGFRYATFLLDDRRTFVHVAANDGEGEAPLTSLASFKAFRAGLAERCESGPDVSPSEVIGSFG